MHCVFAFGDTAVPNMRADKFDVILAADILYSDGDSNKHAMLVQSLQALSHESSVLILSHTWREKERELEFIEKQLSGWELVGRIGDAQFERWRKYGRVGHDSSPGSRTAQAIEIFAFARKQLPRC